MLHELELKADRPIWLHTGLNCFVVYAIVSLHTRLNLIAWVSSSQAGYTCIR
jgi:hypothetical protein